MVNNISVIICAAGVGKRLKSYGPKALIKLHNEETIIQRQIRLVRNILPQSEIIVVAGFEADKIRKNLQHQTVVINNKRYEYTNIGYSLKLGINASNANNDLLIIYGDLVFNDSFLKGLAFTESSAIIDNGSQIRSHKVGVMVVQDYITKFSYGLSIKWAQIAFLTNKENKVLREIINKQNVQNLFGFEILDNVVNMDGNIKAVEPTNTKIVEIDTSKDIKLARELL